MSKDQKLSPIVHMEIENYAMGNNASNIVNNYLVSPSQISDQTPALPNQVLEAISTIKKYLSLQPSNHEIKINKNEVKLNGKLIHVNYEACKICKLQHGNLSCSSCERKVCSKCVVKRSQEIQCLRCKEAKKAQDRVASEFEDKIERLIKLENNDKIKEVVLVEVENLGGKSLEELIEVVRKLEIRSDKLDRSISIAYFYVGKIFYERMEIFFSESDFEGKQKIRKILGSFRHAKDLDFGSDRLSIREIKEKLGIDDKKISRFFGLTLKIYLSYQGFDSPEERIRKAEGVPSTVWLRDLSQEKFLDFLRKLEQRRKEEEEY
ncbi:hypothetical protein C1645_735634 [Glomus cerebriforme]|uniref:Uncharacterized protein n=1 Tax=Glomus cerebriforme TaxID=658196 RepID=A0A397TEG2_9GLOM|nr:hypothetical protein C1645_735634 [Glomus cerebriforme]